MELASSPAAEQAKILLVIEDEESLRHVLRDKLTREGFSVLEAKNGEEGLSAALAEKPDLILLDILLPRMDGVAVLKTLRADAWGRAAKVIVLSNLGANDKIAECIAHGAEGYIVKSDWDLEHVVSFIREKISAPPA